MDSIFPNQLAFASYRSGHVTDMKRSTQTRLCCKYCCFQLAEACFCFVTLLNFEIKVRMLCDLFTAAGSMQFAKRLTCICIPHRDGSFCYVNPMFKVISHTAYTVRTPNFCNGFVEHASEGN